MLFRLYIQLKCQD